MWNALLKGMVAAAVILGLLLVGCGRRPTVLTEGHSGRRVGAYDVEGKWIAYVWYPAQHISTQGHLVVLDVSTGQETELDENLSGPMALGGGRVVWWNGRLKDEAGKGDIRVHDLRTGGAAETIAHAKVQGLDVDVDHVVWAETYEGNGSDIILFDFGSAEQKRISSGGREGDMMHRDPQIRDGLVVWEAYDKKTRSSAIAIFDLASEKVIRVGIPDGHPSLRVSQGRVVYSVKQGSLREIHVYDVATGSDEIIAGLERLKGAPAIEGDKIAWCEHIRREDFKSIPGQPLMDENDIRDVFVCEIGSGKTRRIAKSLLCTGGQVSLHGGRVYLNVYRGYPPPGQSNLVVPVDLWVW